MEKLALGIEDKKTITGKRRKRSSQIKIPDKLTASEYKSGQSGKNIL